MRDIERLAGERGLAFRLPARFPQNSLLAARVGLIGRTKGGWRPSRAPLIWRSSATARISTEDARLILGELGFDPQAILARTQDSGVKERLKRQTADAQALGIFVAAETRQASPLAAKPELLQRHQRNAQSPDRGHRAGVFQGPRG